MSAKQAIQSLDPKKKIAERLRAARETLEITQTELAKQSGVGRSAIVHYENGKAIPGGMELIKLSKVLDITPNYILSGSEQFRESTEPEHALATEEFIPLMIRVGLCLASLDRDVRESVSELLMSLVKQKASKKDYENFSTFADDIAHVITENIPDLEKLGNELGESGRFDSLTQALESLSKEN